MSDRELLELAAKAAGMPTPKWNEVHGYMMIGMGGATKEWSPLEDDGDALRLAVRLNLSIRFDSCAGGVAVDVGGEWDDAPAGAQEVYERDGGAATRRAIVRAAAEIGQSKS